LKPDEELGLRIDLLKVVAYGEGKLVKGRLQVNVDDDLGEYRFNLVHLLLSVGFLSLLELAHLGAINLPHGERHDSETKRRWQQ
jgi:hypothetical protein